VPLFLSSGRGPVRCSGDESTRKGRKGGFNEKGKNIEGHQGRGNVSLKNAGGGGKVGCNQIRLKRYRAPGGEKFSEKGTKPITVGEREKEGGIIRVKRLIRLSPIG